MPSQGNVKFEQEKKLYENRKAAGLCAHCGVRPPYRWMVSCLPCRRRFRTYERRYMHRQQAMKRQGIVRLLCVNCGVRALILCTQCAAHLCDTCYDVGEGRCRDCLVVIEALEPEAQDYDSL